MATAEKKAVRKAQALNRLDDLAVQLGERLGVEVPDLKLKGGDPELAQIQQMEATGDLLDSILKAAEGRPQEAPQTPDGTPGAETTDARGASKRAAKKAAKKSRRK